VRLNDPRCHDGYPTETLPYLGPKGCENWPEKVKISQSYGAGGVALTNCKLLHIPLLLMGLSLTCGFLQLVITAHGKDPKCYRKNLNQTYRAASNVIAPSKSSSRYLTKTQQGGNSYVDCTVCTLQK
jgi:hypothetical protein